MKFALIKFFSSVPYQQVLSKEYFGFKCERANGTALEWLIIVKAVAVKC